MRTSVIVAYSIARREPNGEEGTSTASAGATTYECRAAGRPGRRCHHSRRERGGCAPTRLAPGSGSIPAVLAAIVPTTTLVNLTTMDRKGLLAERDGPGRNPSGPVGRR